MLCGLFEEELTVAQGCLGALVDRDLDGLDVEDAPAFPG